jgi:hypothetical protein
LPENSVDFPYPPHRALHSELRGFSVNAHAIHCPKDAWIFRIRALPDCPIARKARGFSVSVRTSINKFNDLSKP